MNHYLDDKFNKYYKKLPKSVQKKADKNFELLKNNHAHPSLHFKKVKNFWSFRIDKSYRSLGIRNGTTMVWFWIGNHADYDKLIND